MNKIINVDAMIHFVDNIFEGVYFVDNQKKILYWNKAAEFITGLDAKEAIDGCYCDAIVKHEDGLGNKLCGNRCPLAESMQSRTIQKRYAYIHKKNGNRVGLSIKTIPAIVDGVIVGCFQSFLIEDKAPENEKIKQLTRLSFFDALTKIPNRRYIEHILQKQIYGLHRYNSYFSLLFVDVDDFKSINDSFGHDVGDRALVLVANTLKNTTRIGDYVGRYGGDEFLIISSQLKTHAELASYLKRIKEFFKTSFMKDEIFSKHKITISVGGTISQRHETVESILKRSDALMYRAKKSGKDAAIIG